ncbi:MAG: hypothetical protein AAFS06_20775 [Cyanobacteria bacterium J06631_12]
MFSGNPSLWQSLFEIPINKLEDFETVEQKQRLAMAMAMATKLERGCKEPHSLCSPSQIEVVTGYDVVAQHEYGVCLDREAAYGFLVRFTKKKISKASFMRRNTQERYRQVFLREGHAVRKKATVATFAEWLCLENYLLPLVLPQEFVSLLPQDWNTPSGK